MWVEVIGIPGIGKTSFIRNNLEAIEADYKIVTSETGQLFNMISKQYFKIKYAKMTKIKHYSIKFLIVHHFAYIPSQRIFSIVIQGFCRYLLRTSSELTFLQRMKK